MSKKTYSILTAGGMSNGDLAPTFSTYDRAEYLKAWQAVQALVELNVIEEAEAHDPSGTAYIASDEWRQVCIEDGIEMPAIQMTDCQLSGMA